MMRRCETPQKQLLFNGVVRAVDRRHAETQIFSTPWVFAFPDGTARPGKVIPLRTEFDTLQLHDMRLIAITPWVGEDGDKLHDRPVIPWMVTLLITFAHDKQDALDTLLALGTWFNPPPSLFEDVAWSASAPMGAFTDLLED